MDGVGRRTPKGFFTPYAVDDAEVEVARLINDSLSLDIHDWCSEIITLWKR